MPFLRSRHPATLLALSILLLSGVAGATPLVPGEIVAVVSPSNSPLSIVAIDPVSGMYRHVAGPGGPSGRLLDAPRGIRVGPDGQIYVADNTISGGVDSVIRVDPATGNQYYVSVDGLLEAPQDLEILPNGNLLVLDRVNGLIEIDPATGMQQALFSVASQACGVSLVLAGPGAAYMSATAGFSSCLGGVVEIDLLGETSAHLVASASVLASPSGMVLGENGRLLVAGVENTNEIHELDPADGQTMLVASGVLIFGLALEASGDLVGVDFSDDQIVRIDRETGTTSVLVEEGLNPLFGIAVVPASVPAPRTLPLLAASLAMGHRRVRRGRGHPARASH